MPMPRLLPIIAVAIGGVLAVNALAGARSLPDMLSATKAFAEDAVAKAKPAKAEAKAANAVQLAAASPLPPRPTPAQVAAAQAPGACKPTDAAIGKEAGLSPEQMRL